MEAQYRERVARLQANMAEQGVDAYLILTGDDYRYFIGDVRRQPRALIPREGEPTLLVFASEVEEVRQNTGLTDIRPYRGLHEMMLTVMGFFKGLGVERPRVAIQQEFHTPHFLVERFKMANPTVEVVEAGPLVSPLRQIKSAEEVALIREAARLADLGIATARQVIRPGLTEHEVATEVEYVLKKNGADGLGFPMFVNSGYRSLWLHGGATRKVIEPGDLIIVDIGPAYRGYHADICRTFSVGEPSDEARRLYALYRKMQEVALEAARPGVAVHQVEARTEAVLREAGLADHYLRGFLHGVGLSFEETPFPTIFPEDVLKPLQAGMTLAVGHPVLSVPGVGGVRVEDTVLLTEEGIERLTTAPRDDILVVEG
jgi:Xaa-Pro aminopeptidase